MIRTNLTETVCKSNDLIKFCLKYIINTVFIQLTDWTADLQLLDSLSNNALWKDSTHNSLDIFYCIYYLYRLNCYQCPLYLL